MDEGNNGWTDGWTEEWIDGTLVTIKSINMLMMYLLNPILSKQAVLKNYINFMALLGHFY